MHVQLVGPLVEEETFSYDDYAMLVQLENSSHAYAVTEVLEDLTVAGISPDEDTSTFRSLLAFKVSSLLRSQPRQRRIPSPKLKDKHRYIQVRPVVCGVLIAVPSLQWSAPACS